ncbi:ImmA/IrrE family metallo-endopeptidase [Alkalicoccobacillus gibsonii]|uniref:ImmA/IrrE family metallo-endopeptidase n=1 Tax=Alkalicoccobacillus gibsonii TaxID=79881 RepID=UPI003F7B7C9F
MRIKQQVEKLMKKHETDCPYKIAKRLGIQISFEHLGNTLGYYSKHFRIKIIHINQDLNENQKKFVAAHELGHAIRHADYNTQFLKKSTFFSTSPLEKEANTFAIELLFHDGRDYSVTIREAVREYGVPENLALLKSLK